MVTLRPYQPSDTRDVLRLLNAYASFDGTTTTEDLAVTAQFPQGGWVAVVDDVIVGFVYGTLKTVPALVLERWGARGVGEVTLLVVDPKYRKRGIGTALLTKLIEEFKTAEIDLLLLNVPVDAVDAKRLYDRCGFEVRAHYMWKRL